MRRTTIPGLQSSSEMNGRTPPELAMPPSPKLPNTMHLPGSSSHEHGYVVQFVADAWPRASARRTAARACIGPLPATSDTDYGNAIDEGADAVQKRGGCLYVYAYLRRTFTVSHALGVLLTTLCWEARILFGGRARVSLVSRVKGRLVGQAC